MRIPLGRLGLLLVGLAALSPFSPAVGATQPVLRDAGADIEHYLRMQAEAVGADPGEPAARPCSSLDAALAAHYGYIGRAPVPAPPTDPRLATAAACLLDAMMEANRLRDEAFAGVSTSDILSMLGRDDADAGEFPAVDQSRMFQAGIVVARAIDRATEILSDVQPNPMLYPVDLPPLLYIDPVGVDNTHVLDYFLTIELGGDDTYRNSAGGAMIAIAGPALPGPGIMGDEDTFQHVIDLPLDHQVVIGGAFEDADLILGSTIVLDLEGNDTYGVKEAPNTDAVCTSDPVVRRVAIQGTGVASVAMLIDTAGDNNLTAKTIAQGTGHLGGLGVLYLGDGVDRLNAVRSAQGSGVFGGNGLLINRGGDDHYKAESPVGGTFNGDRGICDDIPRYVQGSGFGRSTGGGAGISGFFVEKDGDDEYIAVDKALGHSEVGAIGVFLDRRGNDMYVTHNKSLGFATADEDTGIVGLAIFLDTYGDDDYTVAGTLGLGHGNGALPGGPGTPTMPLPAWLNDYIDEDIRPVVLTAAALFLDTDGCDTYSIGQGDRENDDIEVNGVIGVFVDT